MKRLVVLSVAALCPTASQGLAQIQAQKLVPSDTAYNDQFGTSVAMSGEWAIVGAPFEDSLVAHSGAAYLFQRQGSSWSEVVKLKASDPAFGDQFAAAVAIEGDIAVVSAPGASAGGIDNAGKAYVFERVGDNWFESTILSAVDASVNMRLGESVALSGMRVLVGARQEGHAGLVSGAAYIFEQVGANWVQVAKLIASDGNAGHQFGYDVDMDGDLAVAGAPGVPGPGGSYQGAVYVFEKQAAQWFQTQKLVASDGGWEDYMGLGVGLAGGSIAAYATKHVGHPIGAGAVYVFERPAATWIEVAKLTASDPTLSAGFGRAIALTPGVMVLGSAADDDLGDSSGSSYVIRKVGSSWVQVGKLFSQDGSTGDFFGGAVFVAGDTAIVASVWDDDACPENINCNSGSAYVFALPKDSRQYGSCASKAPCNNADPHGGCVNSTGQGAVLAACGSGSVAADDLVLEASMLPAMVNAIFFMGPSQTSVALGDGLRVVGPGSAGLYRFGVQQASNEGRIVRGPGIVQQSQAFAAPGQIQAGQTWNFQLWYRDVQGPCGNATNVSNGLEVSFTP